MRMINRCQTCGNWIPEFGERYDSKDTSKWSGWGWCSVYNFSDHIWGYTDGNEPGRIGYEDTSKGMYLTYYLNSCVVNGQGRYAEYGGD